MKTTELFDLVAPIAIYHGTDVCFKQKALTALLKLQELENIDHDVRRTFRVFGKISKAWTDYLEYAEPDELPDILDVYKDLFREIVATERPNWTEFVDRWGAYGYKDERGETVFSGDGNGEFPWYETAELLIERLNL